MKDVITTAHTFGAGCGIVIFGRRIFFITLHLLSINYYNNNVRL